MPDQSRKIKVDLDDLARAFDSNDPSISYYLDLEAGQIYPVSEETLLHLDSLYDEYAEDDQAQFNFSAILAELDLSDWERAELLQVHRIVNVAPEAFLRIPLADSRQGYQDMASFSATVQESRLKTRLEQALNKRGAFRNFKDALDAYPAERARWFAFKDDRLKSRAREWLSNEGYTIDE